MVATACWQRPVSRPEASTLSLRLFVVRVLLLALSLPLRHYRLRRVRRRSPRICRYFGTLALITLGLRNSSCRAYWRHHRYHLDCTHVMDTDLLNYPLGVTVLLKKKARVHDTITRESDVLMPLSPWSWTCLPFILTTMGKSSYSYHIHEAKREYSNK
jgi:hypothetical protein